MATISFNPSANANFQFSPVLDGLTYTAICTWNIYRGGYYINIYNSSRALVMSRPIIASPDDYNINLVFGYFRTSTLVYRASSTAFEINP